MNEMRLVGSTTEKPSVKEAGSASFDIQSLMHCPVTAQG